MGVARREAAERRQREREARRRRNAERPPDTEHVWFRTKEAAAFMGVTEPAISQRAREGRLPFVEHDGRRWYRRDHLELVRHADLVKRLRRHRR